LPLSQFLEQFQRVSFFHLYRVYIICTTFILLPLSLPPPHSHQCQTSTLPYLGRTRLDLLFSDFVKEKH
jgi:hypothetical protein